MDSCGRNVWASTALSRRNLHCTDTAILRLLLGRDWFPSQRSLARFSHPDPRWTGLIDTSHFCLVAVSTHAGVEEKLFGLAIAPHHYLLHDAGCHVQTHVTSLAQHKRKETSFLRRLAEGLILHLQNLAEVLVQLTKQANIVSREPGQPGCRQPNASLGFGKGGDRVL